MTSWSLLLVALCLTRAGQDDVNYDELTIEVEGALIGSEWLDIEADGSLELCLTVLTAEGSRELRFYRFRGTSLESEPFRVLPIRDDAIAFGLANLRADAGRELFFLTKSGVWSLSLGKQGYRDNVERVLQSDLIYDVPDQRTLPRWEYVLPGSEFDALLLPTASGFALFGPKSGGETPYGPLTDFAQLGRPEISINTDDEQHATSLSIGTEGFSVDQGSSNDEQPPFLQAPNSRDRTFLANHRNVAAPALLDIDGDGLLDMVFQGQGSLALHLNRQGTFNEKPDREELFPEYLKPKDSLSFWDLDGDGDQDLVTQSGSDEKDAGVENTTHVVLLLLNDGKRLLPTKPNQVLRFEAKAIEISLLDVDADGYLDLAVQKFELPSLVSALGQFELKLSELLFLGQSGERPMSRKPVIHDSRSFDGDNFTEIAPNRSWKLDCTGDGIADIVEVDIQGNLAVMPITRSKGFFGGTSWEMTRRPWYRAQAASRVLEIEVRDLNQDGLGDITSPGSNRLMILFSTLSRR